MIQISILAGCESSVHFLEIPVEFEMDKRGSCEKRVYNIVFSSLENSVDLPYPDIGIIVESNLSG